MRIIAALFVETGGTYYGLENVNPWDEKRDARLYPGPYPCVAHPPCQRWGRFWHGSTAREDYSFCAKCLNSMTAYKFWKKIIDDAGCGATRKQGDAF